jgi:poly(beta-D-mannuronate) lyase
MEKAAQRFHGIVVMCLVSFWVGMLPIAVEKAAACPSYPPVLNLSAETMYTDAKGSMADQTAIQNNNAKQAPIIDFISYAAASLDGAPPWRKATDLSASCANGLLESWAKANALSTVVGADGKYNKQADAERQEFTRSFVILALKARQQGMQLGPDVIPWLGRLVDDNDRHWQEMSLRTNLYDWAGATAAAYFLLAPDKDAYDFQNQVWAEALAAIRDDGYLDAELGRGIRALVYHQYALSALLTLREARRAMGIPILDAEQRRLKLLADRVGAALCHPDEMASKAGVAKVEIPGEWGFREMAAYGTDLVDADWRQCGVTVKNFVDTKNGGDQLKTRAMFVSFEAFNNGENGLPSSP